MTTTTTKTTTPATSARFDPWAGCPDPRTLRLAVLDAMPAQDIAPMTWHVLPIAAREIIGAGAIAVLAANQPAARGDLDRLTHVLWNDVRTREYDANGRTCDAALSDPQIGSPLSLLRETLSRLLATRDVLAALQQRRDAINAQIERLEKLHRPLKATTA